MKNKFLLLICLTFAIRPLNSAVPVVAYSLGTKITGGLIAMVASGLALLGIIEYRERRTRAQVYEAMKKYDTEPVSNLSVDPDPDDEENKRKEKREKPKNSELDEFAEFLDYNKTNDIVHGQRMYKNSSSEISYDVDGHNGGFWKMWKHGIRYTMNIFLNKKIGD